MLYPIAIETGDEDHGYGVVFPDLPGCFSAGDSLEEALTNAKESVEFYLEDLAERDQLPPKASSLSTLEHNEEYKNWAWAIIDVDIEPFMGKSAKLNVTLPRLLMKKIDDQVKAHPNLYSSVAR